MNIVANNGASILLDEELTDYELMEPTAVFVIYHQFLNQLHLHFEKWEYSKVVKGKIAIKKAFELELLDPFIFKSLQYSKIVSPARIYLYFLLQTYFGNSFDFGTIGVLRDKKCRFIYLTDAINFENMKQIDFKTNTLSNFVLKWGKRKEIQNMHETFFVLINESFKPKLSIALTQFQSESGNVINKMDWIDTVLNESRLKTLSAFSQKLINRL